MTQAKKNLHKRRRIYTSQEEFTQAKTQAKTQALY